MKVRDLTVGQVILLILAAIVIILSINVLLFAWVSAPSGG